MGGTRGESSRDSGPEDNGLPRVEIFRLLSNRRRRYALYYLLEDEDGATIGELAEQLAAWENEEPVEQVTSRQRKLVYNSLQQTHLPTLAETEIVEYDEREGAVELTTRIEAVNPYLNLASDREMPWSRIYLLLAGVTGLLAVGLWVDLTPLTAVDPTTWLMLMSGAILACAIVHYRRTRSDGNASTDEPPEVGDDRP